MQLDFFLKSYTEKKTNKKIVALTFDDGPHPTYTPIVLGLLKQYNIKATFFCIGKNIEAYPELFKQIVNDGHAIGNHSYSHKSTIGLNGTKCWITEIENTDIAIEKITNIKPKLFRPPFGVTTPHLAKAIVHTGHRVIGWNVRPFDTKMSTDFAIDRIKKQIKPGAIVLLHDTHSRIETTLEHTLIYLQQEGYTAVSVNELMNEE